MRFLCQILRDLRLVLHELQATADELCKTLRKLKPLLNTIDQVSLRALVIYELWKLRHP